VSRRRAKRLERVGNWLALILVLGAVGSAAFVYWRWEYREQRFDRELWSKLIDSDILSSAAASVLGGDGFGVLEQVAILVALGHQMAAVPYLESVMLASGALARFGRRSRARKSLPSPWTARWARGRCGPRVPVTATG